MSNSELPEDLNQWPRDPYQVLGVNRTDDAGTIRKAYTRLIRRFKPEHHPDHFIRLREAYEQITSRAAETTWLPVPEPWLTQSQIVRRQVEQASTAPNSTGPFGLDKVWNLAAQGLFHEALALLQSPEWSQTELPSVRLVEYWITKLKFPLPGDSQAATLLLTNMHLFRRLPNVLRMAEQELRHHPDLVSLVDLSRCLEGLLTADDILDVAQLRWTVAIASNKFELLSQDWSTFSLTYFEYHELRSHLAFAILDYLIWSPQSSDQELATRIASELEAELGLKNMQSRRFDRLDQLKLLREELRAFLRQYPQWYKFEEWVPCMWNDMPANYASQVLKWLLQALDNPTDALTFLDDVQIYPHLREYCIRRFEQLLQDASADAHPGPDDPQVRLSSEATWHEMRQIEEFLCQYDNEPYAVFRVSLARLALRHCLTLGKICRFINAKDSMVASYFSYDFLNRIKADRALNELVELLGKRMF